MSDQLIKTVAILIIASVLIIVLRSRLQEYAFLGVVAILAVVFLSVFDSLLSSISDLKMLFNKSGSNSIYFTTALKALGIAYISGFAADVCRDFGLSALANTAEIVGKVTIFVLSVPLAATVIEAALKFADL